MARPEPTITMSIDDENKTTHICTADGVYVVTLDGKPFRLRCDYPDGRIKYPSIAFTTIGQARAAARRLNRKFKTNRFEVVGIE